MNITSDQKIYIQGHTVDMIEELCSTHLLTQPRAKCLMMVLVTPKLINNKTVHPTDISMDLSDLGSPCIERDTIPR